MEVTTLFPEDIVVRDRLRGLNRKAVDQLKESIKRLGGIKTPLSVRFLSEEEGWQLVAGRHRLQAAIELEMHDVPVREETGTEIDARMWEIAENLHRAELTVLERSEHIAEWIRLCDEPDRQMVQVAPSVLSDGRGAGPQHQERGLRAAARELGVEHTGALRAVAIGELPEEVKAEAKALHLDDNQSALLDAAKAPTPAAQVAKLRERAERKAAPRAPRVPTKNPNKSHEGIPEAVDAPGVAVSAGAVSAPVSAADGREDGDSDRHEIQEPAAAPRIASTVPEKQQAIALAHRVLDRVGAGPDDDLAVLARQLLRAIERPAVPPGPEGTVPFYIKPGDRQYAGEAAVQMFLYAFGADDGSGISARDLADNWSADKPLLSDQVTLITEAIMDFEVRFRAKYGAGNDAALAETK